MNNLVISWNVGIHAMAIRKTWVVNKTMIDFNPCVLWLSRCYQDNEQCTNYAIDGLMINHPTLVNVGQQGLGGEQDNDHY